MSAKQKRKRLEDRIRTYDAAEAPYASRADVGAAMRAEREKASKAAGRKITQSEFAPRFGLTQAQVSKLETGKMVEFSAAVERGVLAMIGPWRYGYTPAFLKKLGSPPLAQPMQQFETMKPEETVLIFPLLRSALDLLRHNGQDDVALLTTMAQEMNRRRPAESPRERAKGARQKPL